MVITTSAARTTRQSAASGTPRHVEPDFRIASITAGLIVPQAHSRRAHVDSTSERSCSSQRPSGGVRRWEQRTRLWLLLGHEPLACASAFRRSRANRSTSTGTKSVNMACPGDRGLRYIPLESSPREDAMKSSMRLSVSFSTCRSVIGSSACDIDRVPEPMIAGVSGRRRCFRSGERLRGRRIRSGERECRSLAKPSAPTRASHEPPSDFERTSVPPQQVSTRAWLTSRPASSRRPSRTMVYAGCRASWAEARPMTFRPLAPYHPLSTPRRPCGIDAVEELTEPARAFDIRRLGRGDERNESVTRSAPRLGRTPTSGLPRSSMALARNATEVEIDRPRGACLAATAPPGEPSSARRGGRRPTPA